MDTIHNKDYFIKNDTVIVLFTVFDKCINSMWQIMSDSFLRFTNMSNIMEYQVMEYYQVSFDKFVFEVAHLKLTGDYLRKIQIIQDSKWTIMFNLVL